MKSTHTFVELQVSREAYLEIYTLLAEAGYHHAFTDGAIDMHGVTLTKVEKGREIRDFDHDCIYCRNGARHYIHRKVERNEHGSPSGYPLKASAHHPKHGAGVVNGWSNYKGDTFYVDYEVGHREGYTLDELMPLIEAAITKGKGIDDERR